MATPADEALAALSLITARGYRAMVLDTAPGFLVDISRISALKDRSGNPITESVAEGTTELLTEAILGAEDALREALSGHR